MRHRKLLAYCIVGIVAATIAQGVASAQAPARTSGTGGAAPTPSPQPELTPAQQLDMAQSYLSDMETIRSRTRQELEKARNARDVVKTLCLDDKLNQLDVALRSAEERKRSLELAVQRGDAELAGHEHTILKVLHERAQQIGDEANLCIGKEVVYVEGSSVTMEVDPGLPIEDPAAFPDAPLMLQFPNCASCYK